MIPPIDIEFSSLNFISIVPMLITLCGALTILLIDLFTKRLDKSFYLMVAILFLVVSIGVLYGYSGAVRGFFDLMLIDGISIFAQYIILIGTILFLLLTLNRLTFHENSYPEHYALYMFAATGFQFMVSSDSLILIFIGLETASMSLYVLIALHNKSKSLEASIKYFTMGAFATGFFAFGSMIFYAVTGSVELGQISQVLMQSDFANYPIILAGVVFIVAALGFKLSLFPFHTWVADVYEGSSSLLAGYLSVVPKIATFVVAVRFFEIFIAANDEVVHIMLYVIAILTMTVPNIVALLQNDMKRMLGYSSISHAGFVLVAVLIGTSQGTIALFMYWILFLVTNLGAFALLWVNQDKQDGVFASSHSLEKFSGLIKTSPFMAITFAIFLLSLAGVPPFALFWGKMYLISSTINAGHIILAIIMVVNSAIAAYYYLKPIVFIFLKEPLENTKVEHNQNGTKALKNIITGCAILVTISIIFIDWLLETISYYVQISGY